MDMRRMLVLAVAALACGDSTSPGRPGDLVMQRALWEGRAIHSYDFDLTSSNEWFPTRTTRVSVRSGVVTKIVAVATGDSIGPGSSPGWPTMDDLFDRAAEVLESAEAEKGEYVVLFHPTLSYITRLSSDRFDWADDSFTYVVRNLIRR